MKGSLQSDNLRLIAELEQLRIKHKQELSAERDR
jgi:hypothetical protein